MEAIVINKIKLAIGVNDNFGFKEERSNSMESRMIVILVEWPKF